jgi:hypothetical protein
MPNAIVSDRGTNFTSKLFKYFCEKLKIKHRLTTSYHPASNGETERFNRTITTMLRKQLKDGNHEDWEDLIDPLLFAYRNSIHSSSNETPYYIIHGRDANIPINEFLGAIPKTNISPSDYVGNLVNRLRYTFQRVREESEKARERQREQYNKRAKENKYVVGDRVLLDIVVVQTGDSKKFTSKYKGPFRVIKTYNNKTVDIADNSYNIQRVHVNRLKPLFETMLWKDEACPEIEKPAEIKDPRFKSISTQVTEGAEDEKDEINSEESNISSNSNEDEDDEINSEESSISSESNGDGWETFSNESDSIETENEENVNDVGLTDEENSSIDKNNAEKETTKVNANEKEKGLHTERKSTSKEKKGSNIQKAKNRNSRSYRERVSPCPPSPVLADIIFNAPSTPTQPLQANLHPVATAVKKKETKKKKQEK